MITGLFCILFLNVYAAPRELLVNPEKPDSWLGKVEPAPQYERGKGPCFVLYGGYPTVFRYKTLIPVDAAKTYTYKVTMRTLDPALPASGYLGFYLYDKNKRSIRYCEVLPLANSKSQVVSARKGEHEFVIGNIVGSNFFNMLGVVGVAGVIAPFDNFSRFITVRDLPLIAALSLSIAVFGINFRSPRRQGVINRLEGAIWLLVFAAYLALLLRQETGV